MPETGQLNIPVSASKPCPTLIVTSSKVISEFLVKIKELTSDGVNTIQIKILVLNIITSKNQTNTGNRNQISAKI